jgi:hypothetical protein
VKENYEVDVNVSWSLLQGDSLLICVTRTLLITSQNSEHAKDLLTLASTFSVRKNISHSL